MQRSIARFCLVIAALAATGCGHLPAYENSVGLRGCPDGRLLVCPIDRPTVADPRVVRASGLCRCTVML
jgi:hypothetical protein